MRWHSFELRPPGSPPMPAEYRAYIESARPRLAAMARQQYGLEINTGVYETSSRDALVGAKYAETQGVGDAYHAAVFKAFWQEAEDIGRREQLADIAESLGLERSAFLAALDDARYRAQVAEDVRQARAYGLSAVPALVYNDKYLVSGAQPYEVLAQVAERVATESED